MDAQLTHTAEQYPFVRRARTDWTTPRLSVPEHHMPITGQQFAHFMAFLERDFRIFDFYAGMADAHVYLAREECLFSPEGDACDGAGALRQLDAELQQANPLYRCMRAYYDSEDFEVLKPISTADLPEACRSLREVDCGESGWRETPEAVGAYLASRAVLDRSGPDACVQPSIANHNFRALIVGMHNYKVWTQSDQYAETLEFDRFCEELGGGPRSEQFIFVDLPTYQWSERGYLSAAEVKEAFRELMQVGIDQLAAEQEPPSRLALLMGGRAAADLVYQRNYPKRIVGVGVVINGLEGVYGRRLWGSKWRWDTALRFFRLNRSSYARDLTPFTGELYFASQATRIFSPIRYADLELGAGWAVSETLAMSGPAKGHVALRTGPRGYAAFVLLQRIYLGVNLDYYPFDHIGQPYAATPNPVVDNWVWSVAGGWRMLF